MAGVLTDVGHGVIIPCQFFCIGSPLVHIRALLQIKKGLVIVFQFIVCHTQVKIERTVGRFIPLAV